MGTGQSKVQDGKIASSSLTTSKSFIGEETKNLNNESSVWIEKSTRGEESYPDDDVIFAGERIDRGRLSGAAQRSYRYEGG